MFSGLLLYDCVSGTCLRFSLHFYASRVSRMNTLCHILAYFISSAKCKYGKEKRKSDGFIRKIVEHTCGRQWDDKHSYVFIQLNTSYRWCKTNDLNAEHWNDSIPAVVVISAICNFCFCVFLLFVFMLYFFIWLRSLTIVCALIHVKFISHVAPSLLVDFW